MAKKHMKRQLAPVTWKINRKGTTFLARPDAGKSFNLSMPISLIFKNLLKYCKTTKEVKSILLDKEVIVDGKQRKNYKFPMGLMDVMSFPVSDEHFRMVLNKKGKLEMVKVDAKEAEIKPSKISSKKKLKNGKMQINFFQGRNIIVDKDEGYPIGSVVFINLKKNEIEKNVKAEKEAFVLLIGGKNIGERGVIEKIEGKTVHIINENKKEIITDSAYAFPLGIKKPEITIEEK